MKTQKIIAEGNFDRTDFNGIYNLYLAAFGDESLARGARLKAMEALVDAQCKTKTS